MRVVIELFCLYDDFAFRYYEISKPCESIWVPAVRFPVLQFIALVFIRLCRLPGYGRRGGGPRLPVVVTPLVELSCETSCSNRHCGVPQWCCSCGHYTQLIQLMSSNCSHGYTESSLKRLRYLYYLLLFFLYLLSSSFQVQQVYPAPKHPPIPTLLSYQLEIATTFTNVIMGRKTHHWYAKLVLPPCSSTLMP